MKKYLFHLYYFAINQMNFIDCISLATPRKISAFGTDFDIIFRYIDRKIILVFLFLILSGISSPLVAESDSATNIEDRAYSSHNLKNMLIVEFSESLNSDSRLAMAIAQAKKEFVSLEVFRALSQKELFDVLEKKADEDLGIVVFIKPPQNWTEIEKVPALYPDLSFVVIDSVRPFYAANLQIVWFEEEDGAFLLGSIAALGSSGKITILASSESERNKILAEKFTAGARLIKSDIIIEQNFNIDISQSQHSNILSAITAILQNDTSMIFALDDVVAEPALRAAKKEAKLVVAASNISENIEHSRLLTYVVRRYDLALLDVLRIYAHGKWKSGVIKLGLSGGYVDYSLNTENVEIFPKESIDRIEEIKDYISQGIYNKKENTAAIVY